MDVGTISTTEVWDGMNYVNGLPHGAKWKKMYAVTVYFPTEVEAKEFVDRLSGDRVKEVMEVAV